MDTALEIAKKTAEAGAQQSAQYWLVFVLSLGGIVAFIAARYLVGRLEKQTDMLAGLFKEANEGRVRCAEIVAGNAEVVRECKSTIAECNRCMARTNDRLAHLENKP